MKQNPCAIPKRKKNDQNDVSVCYVVPMVAITAHRSMDKSRMGFRIPFQALHLSTIIRKQFLIAFDLFRIEHRSYLTLVELQSEIELASDLRCGRLRFVLVLFESGSTQIV